MANETVELYYKGKPINPNRDLPTRTYAEAQAEGLTSSDKLWVRNDAPQSDLIVDNLTTDDSARALSAKQGKVLNDKITSFTTVDLSQGSGYSTYINVLTRAKAIQKNSNVNIAVSASLKSVSGSGAWVELFTIPNTISKPTIDITISTQCANYSDAIFLDIKSDGKINIYNPHQVSGLIAFEVSYIV